jgi:hypothetical protein
MTTLRQTTRCSIVSAFTTFYVGRYGACPERSRAEAELGRFIQADTIVPSAANPQSLNRYSYVYNNPLNHIDPTGHVGSSGLLGNLIKIGFTIWNTIRDTFDEAIDAFKEVTNVLGFGSSGATQVRVWILVLRDANGNVVASMPVALREPAGTDISSYKAAYQATISFFNGAASWISHPIVGLYTGNPSSSKEVFTAAVEAAGDYVFEFGGVRGGYFAVGGGGKLEGKGNLAGIAGVMGEWTVDDGASVSLEGGLGLQDRGRNSLGQFTSQAIGAGGGYEIWNEKNGFQGPVEGGKFSGIYGGTAQNGPKVKGGANFGIEAPQKVFIGINYGPAASGLVVDPSRVLINFRDSYNILFH